MYVIFGTSETKSFRSYTEETFQRKNSKNINLDFEKTLQNQVLNARS